MTYTFTATSPGTHSYYSGTQADLQVEMGMYGALIVLPTNVPAQLHRVRHSAAKNVSAETHVGREGLPSRRVRVRPPCSLL